MKRILATSLMVVVLGGSAASGAVDPIAKVEVGPHGEFRVNDAPFFPLISWLQGANTYERLAGLGFNVFMGNWQSKPPAPEMGDLALKAGGYALPHFDGTGIGHPGVFGWMDLDEPDITSRESDAVVKGSKGLIANRRAPLTNLVDGNTRNSAAIDPMEGASVTVELPAPVTATEVAIWVGPNKDASAPTTTLPSEVVFLGDDKELARMPVEDKAGRQKVALPAPATFQRFEVRVTGVRKGANVWGLVNEVEALDTGGASVVKSEPKGKVRRRPADSLAKYREMKAADPSRPVFLTLTCRFLERYEQWHKMPKEEMRAMYPQWAQATDALGTDIYPIYGFSKPEWLLDNIAAVRKMRELAGPGKPLYVWIETCDGGAQQGADLHVLPRHTRSQVWMSIVAGARGIGYFTHAFKPKFNDFAPSADMQAELKRINAQITRLAPELLAKPADDKVSIAFADGIEGHCMATETDGSLLIVAQNLDVAGKDGLGGRAGKARVAVAGLKAGTRVEVVDEGREIVAVDGAFEDAFDALAEHIYRIGR